MRVFSWTKIEHPAVSQLIWADCRGSPAARATQLAPELLRRPDGGRAVFFWQVFWNLLRQSDEILLRKGIAWEQWQGWFRAFFKGLKGAGATPDILVLDYEEGLSVWRWFGSVPCDGPNGTKPRVELMRKFYGWLGDRLPQEVRVHGPEDYYCHGPGHEAYRLWNRWAGKEVRSAMTRACVDTATEVFGHAIPASNYGDMYPSFRIYDVNGWEFDREDGGGISDWSSPVIYLHDMGGRYTHMQKHAKWNRLIDCLNMLRSCFVTSDKVMPWVDMPPVLDPQNPAQSAGEQWLWLEMIKHARATGTETFLYFNPIDRELAAAATKSAMLGADGFAIVAKQPAARQKLPEIPSDADEFVTADVKTTYADFRKAFGI